MNEHERAIESLFRLGASLHRAEAARLDLAAAAVRAKAAVRVFGEVFQRSSDLELAGHPDLAELNVMVDALYNPPSS